MAERRAAAMWEGTLLDGKGTLSAESSRVFTDLPVTWASRTEEPGGMTSPEELIAAAHAACYSMSLAHELTGRGTPPSRLEVRATSSAEKGEAGWKMTAMDLDVVADVPGLDDARFQDAVRAAESGCPVSNALRGNIDFRVKASLR